MSVRALKACHAMAEDPSVTEYLTYFIKRPDVFRVSTMPVTTPTAGPSGSRSISGKTTKS